MKKNKVTLSIDSKVYSDFKKYCEDNAIMLSKKIELLMKNILKHKKDFLIIMLFMVPLLSVYALTFSDFTMGDFNNGTYANTTYNGTGVTLSGNNVSGSFTSRIFDASTLAHVSSVNLSYTAPNTTYLFAVDANAAVYISKNGGINWTQQNASYGGGGGSTVHMFADSLYLYIIFSSTNKRVYRSGDLGISWSIINKSFTGPSLDVGGADSSNLYVLRGNGEVSRSNNHGITWNQSLGDINPGSNTPKGLAINLTNALFAVDGAGRVARSTDQGLTWTQQNASYGGGAGTDDMVVTQGGNLYILFDKSVYRSTDQGISWTVINTSFTPYASDGSKMLSTPQGLFISDGNGKIFFSNNGGFSWSEIADINGASSANIKGLGSLPLTTSLNFQIRNCSSVCSSEPYTGPDGSVNTYFTESGSNLNLTGRYFQYRLYFSGNDALTPVVRNVSLTYSLLDTSAPQIILHSPSNITYGISSIFLNYSASDSSGISVCRYIIDGTPVPLPGCATTTLTGLSDGSHTLSIHANDTLGNSNSSSVVFSIDTQAPLWSSVAVSHPVSYSPTQISFFNISWTDEGTGVQSVWLESNFSGQSANYTMYHLEASVYGFNASLPAGTHFWRTYANDSLGNVNASVLQTVSIAKAGNALTLRANGNASNISVQYGIQTNVTASASSGVVSLTRDGASVNNPDIALLGSQAEGYHYVASAAGNENYSSNSSELFVFVTKQSPVLSLTLNEIAGNVAMYYGNTSIINASESNMGDGDVTYTLYRGGTTRGIGSLLSETSVLAAGTYVYSYNSSGGQNYTASSVSYVLTVNKTTPVIRLFLNGSESSSTQVYGSVSNATAYISAADIPFTLLRDGISVGTGLGTLSEVGVLAAGTYNYTSVFEGNENYTAAQTTLFLTNQRATPVVSLLLNGGASDFSLPLGSLLTVNATISSPSFENISLYEDGSLVGTSHEIISQRNYSSLDTHTWEASFAGNQNYTSHNVSFSATILDASSPQYSQLSTAPSTPVSYIPAATYWFNATWTDNVGVDAVILSFNGANYTYPGPRIMQNGNEYSFNISDLGVGNYSYRWYARDTSNNTVATPVRVYSIVKATPVLFITFTPSSSVDYGTNVSVSCIAGNSQISFKFFRNGEGVQGTDTPDIPAGTYFYECTFSGSENYTARTVNSFLTIARAAPTLGLALNGFEGDLQIPSGGAMVHFNASIIRPHNGQINLTLNGAQIQQGFGVIENFSVISIVGDHQARVVYGGNENFTAGSLTRTIQVSAPAASSPSSGGGGGGAGGGRPIIPRAEFSIEPVSIRKGSATTVNVEVRNTGTRFLNNCRLVGAGAQATWISETNALSLSPGQDGEYALTIAVPLDASAGIQRMNVQMLCQEYSGTEEFELTVTQTKFDFSFLRYERVGTELRVYYSAESLTGNALSLTVNYSFLNQGGTVLTEGVAAIELPATGREEGSFEFELPKDSFGEFSLGLAASSAQDVVTLSEPILLPASTVTGLAISDNNRRALAVMGILVLVSLALFIGLRMVYLRYYAPPHKHRWPLLIHPKKGSVELRTQQQANSIEPDERGTFK